MIINTIFAIQKIYGNLYSVQFEENKPHALEQIFDDWKDPEVLFDFFEDNKEDLQSGFFGEISVSNAIEITMLQAEQFENQILKLSKQSLTNYGSPFDKLFVNLINAPAFNNSFLNISVKAYGPNSQAKTSWLRVYAIRVDNVFIITGGAIKLTKNMNDRTHTKIEYDKLRIVVNSLKENFLTEKSDFNFDFFQLEI
jgi:hypothetical protein